MASVAARLLRAYATQVEALSRLRNGGSQTVRVEHVHVNEGGQAVIGNLKSTWVFPSGSRARCRLHRGLSPGPRPSAQTTEWHIAAILLVCRGFRCRDVMFATNHFFALPGALELDRLPQRGGPGATNKSAVGEATKTRGTG
jgi:hypothetical protein